VATPTGPMWRLRSGRLGTAPAGTVALLPSFDEYLLGWKDRSFIAEPGDWAKVYPGGGWYHPALVVDGRAAGTWSMERGRGARVEVRPFARLAPAVRNELGPAVDDLGAFLGVPATLV
jgi:hypothetical protein